MRALFGAVGGTCNAFGGTGVVGNTGTVTRERPSTAAASAWYGSTEPISAVRAGKWA